MKPGADDNSPQPDLRGTVPEAPDSAWSAAASESVAMSGATVVDGTQDPGAGAPVVDASPAALSITPAATQATVVPPAQDLADLAALPAAPIVDGRPQRSNRRAGLLFAGGLATVAVAYALAPGGHGAGVVDAVAPARGGAALSAKPGAEALVAPPRREALPVQAAADPFVGTSFAPPPPPPPPPPPVVIAPPPPPPTAPPLPYSFVGMLEKGPGKPAAFIARGETLLIVSAGDVLEGTYRVDVLKPHEIVLTYLPLNQRQSLNLSGKNP